MRSLKEFIVAIIRIFLGIVALLGGLVILDLLVYITTTSSSYDELVAAAYERSYSQGYEQNYYVAYREGYGRAYEKGYNKGYEIGLARTRPEEIAATLVALRTPTYEELRAFLSQDRTDTNLYSPGEYVSLDFAVDLNNNAEAAGIRAAFVTIVFPEKSHGIVAFETTDKGLIFIEPQSDMEVEPIVGRSYWQAAGGVSPVYYDDTIVELQLLW